MPLQGRYYDGQTAQSDDIQLELDADGILHCHPELFQPLALREVKLSPRIGTIARTLTFPSGAVIETTDHAILDEWLSRHQINQGFVHKLENSLKYVIGSVAFMALFVAWTAIYGIPMFSTVAANALPAEASIYIGDGAMEAMDERFFDASELDEDYQQQLTEKFMQLLPDAENKGEITYSLLFRKGGFIGANAFALPNGIVVVTDELVNLAEHDEEIYSVILHEIGHVEHRHSLRQVISHSGLAILTVLITGDVNSAGAMIVALPNILMSTSYSRDIEWEADSYALERMQKLSIPPSRFADFMEKLDTYVPEFDYDEEWLSELDEVSDEGQEIAVNEPIEIAKNEASEQIEAQDDEVKQQECNTADNDYDYSDEDYIDFDLGWFSYISTHPPSEDRIARFRDAENNDN